MRDVEEEQALKQTYIAQVHIKFDDTLSVVFLSSNHFKVF